MNKKITIVLIFNDKNINIANTLSKLLDIDENKSELIIFNECFDSKNKNIIYLFLGLISRFNIQYFESGDFYNELECINEVLEYIRTEYVLFLNNINFLSFKNIINKIYDYINDEPQNILLLNEKNNNIDVDKPILIVSKMNYISAVYSVRFLKSINFSNINFSFNKLFFLIILFTNKKRIDVMDVEYLSKEKIELINYSYNIFLEIQQIYNFFLRKKMFQNSREEIEYLFTKLLVITYFNYFKGKKTQSLYKKIKKSLNDFLLNYKNNSYINNDVDLLEKFKLLLKDINGK